MSIRGNFGNNDKKGWGNVFPTFLFIDDMLQIDNSHKNKPNAKRKRKAFYRL